MDSVDPHDEQAVLARLKAQAALRRYRLSTHAEGRQLKHDVTLEEIFEAVSAA